MTPQSRDFFYLASSCVRLYPLPLVFRRARQQCRLPLCLAADFAARPSAGDTADNRRGSHPSPGVCSRPSVFSYFFQPQSINRLLV